MKEVEMQVMNMPKHLCNCDAYRKDKWAWKRILYGGKRISSKYGADGGGKVRRSETYGIF